MTEMLNTTSVGILQEQCVKRNLMVRAGGARWLHGCYKANRHANRGKLYRKRFCFQELDFKISAKNKNTIPFYFYFVKMPPKEAERLGISIKNKPKYVYVYIFQNRTFLEETKGFGKSEPKLG